MAAVSARHEYGRYASTIHRLQGRVVADSSEIRFPESWRAAKLGQNGQHIFIGDLGLLRNACLKAMLPAIVLLVSTDRIRATAANRVARSTITHDERGSHAALSVAPVRGQMAVFVAHGGQFRTVG